MAGTKTISASITPQLLERVDNYVETGKVQNRSEAIRKALDQMLSDEEKAVPAAGGAP